MPSQMNLRALMNGMDASSSLFVTRRSAAAAAGPCKRQQRAVVDATERDARRADASQ